MPTVENVLGSRINILVLRLLSAIRGPLSGNQIATRLGFQQSSVRQALERLVNTGVVTSHDVGRSAGYELDRGLAFTRHVVAPLFGAAAQRQNRDKLRSKLSSVFGNKKPRNVSRCRA